MEVQFQTYDISFSAKRIYPLIPKTELKKYMSLGYTYNKIATIRKVPIDTVSRSMSVYGVKSNKTIRREENILRIKEMAEKGFSEAEIIKELGVSKKAIENALTPEPKQETTLDKVLKKLNMTHEDVKKYLK